MEPSIWNEHNLASASAVQMGTKAWAQANQLSYVNSQLAKDNANRVDEYNAQFARYSQEKEQRPEATDIFPPVPAIAEVVVFTEDGWASVGPGTEYVCVMKVWQPPVKTARAWFTAGASDPASAPAIPFPSSVLYIPFDTPDGRTFIRTK